MSDAMFYGVLRMPYEMAMSGEISRYQFWSRAQEAADRVERTEKELAAARALLRDVIADHGIISHIDSVVAARNYLDACDTLGEK